MTFPIKLSNKDLTKIKTMSKVVAHDKLIFSSKDVLDSFKKYDIRINKRVSICTLTEILSKMYPRKTNNNKTLFFKDQKTKKEYSKQSTYK